MSTIWTEGALWLVPASAIASVLILLALLLARLTPQPARRQRLCEMALAAALLATALRMTPAWLVIGLPLKTQEPSALPSVAMTLQMSHQLWAAQRLLHDHAAGSVAPLPPPAQAEEAPKPAADSLAHDDLMPQVGAVAAVSLVVLYGAGVLFFLVRWLGGLLYLRRLVRDTEPVPSAISELWGVSRNQGRRPRLLLSRRLRVPISCGVWRPAVVLPAEFCEPGARAKLTWIFAHELTHIERRDAASALLFALGQAVFFHLPWFWQLRKQVRLCQEFVADASAALERPTDEYAEFLLSLTETKAAPLGATGVGGPVSDLYRRVTMLLENPLRVEKSCPRLWSWGVVGVLVALAALLGVLRAEAADTIVIIIPGQKANQPAKDDKPPAGDVKDKDAFRLWLERAPDKEKAVVLRLDNKGNVIKEGGSTILPGQLDRLKPGLPMTRVVFEVKDAKNAPAGKDELERLKKVVQELEEILRISPDAKDLGELTNRLKDRIKMLRANPALTPKADDLPKRKSSAESDKPAWLLFDRVGEAQELLSVAEAQVDLKKLEKLLERLQDAPGKVDPKEISKALEEIRKAAPAFDVLAGQELDLQKLDTQFLNLFAYTDQQNKGRFGIRFSPPSADLREHLGLAKDQGIVIEEVFSDTPAAKAGLKAKDIIVKLNDKAVPSDAEKALKIFDDVKDGASVDLTILRRGKEKVIKGIKPMERQALVIDAFSFDNLPMYLNRIAVAESDQVPDKGALVSILNDGTKFTAKHREKHLSITIQGNIKDGKPADVNINLEVDGKTAFKGTDPAAVPERWRQRVNRLLELSRVQELGLEPR